MDTELICFICGDSNIKFIEFKNEMIHIDDFNFDNEPGKCFCETCDIEVNYCFVCGSVSNYFEFAEIDGIIYKFGKLDTDLKPTILLCDGICLHYHTQQK